MCYYPISGTAGAIGTAAILQGTFGLSVSAKATKEEAKANSNCAADYLEFAGGKHSGRMRKKNRTPTFYCLNGSLNI